MEEAASKQQHVASLNTAIDKVVRIRCASAGERCRDRPRELGWLVMLWDARCSCLTWRVGERGKDGERGGRDGEAAEEGGAACTETARQHPCHRLAHLISSSTFDIVSEGETETEDEDEEELGGKRGVRKKKGAGREVQEKEGAVEGWMKEMMRETQERNKRLQEELAEAQRKLERQRERDGVKSARGSPSFVSETDAEGEEGGLRASG
eukprot:1119295-Rhodomonas_salina.1